MFQIYYTIKKYKINKVLPTIITDFVNITLFVCLILIMV